LQGLNVSTPEEALEKLLSGVVSTLIAKGLQHLLKMKRRPGSTRLPWKRSSSKISCKGMC
jgi:hypothetical protein